MGLKQVMVMAGLGLHAFTAVSGELRLYTWEAYFSQQLLDDFKKETGHTVNQVYFENETLRDDVVYSGKAASYDLFIIDGYALKTLANGGIIAPLPDALSSTLNRFSSNAKAACGDYGVPYAQGSIGIGYRESEVTGAFNSWMDLFHYIQDNPNKAVIPNHGIDTVAIALMALGYHPMSAEQSELEEAFLLLRSSVRNLLAYRNTFGYVMEKQEQSEMVVSVFYSGEKESISLYTKQDDWKYVIPKEGTLNWFECLATHANRPMNDATIAFLAFINEPKNAIANAEQFWFATANQEALALASTAYLNDRELFPLETNQAMKYYYQYLDADTRAVRNNMVRILVEE